MWGKHVENVWLWKTKKSGWKNPSKMRIFVNKRCIKMWIISCRGCHEWHSMIGIGALLFFFSKIPQIGMKKWGEIKSCRSQKQRSGNAASSPPPRFAHRVEFQAASTNGRPACWPSYSPCCPRQTLRFIRASLSLSLSVSLSLSPRVLLLCCRRGENKTRPERDWKERERERRTHTDRERGNWPAFPCSGAYIAVWLPFSLGKMRTAAFYPRRVLADYFLPSTARRGLFKNIRRWNQLEKKNSFSSPLSLFFSNIEKLPNENSIIDRKMNFI